MSYIFLGIIILINFTMWIYNRWAMHSSARPEMIGICVSITGMVASTFMAIINEQKIFVPRIMLLGGIQGIAYAIGYCMIILYCLKIGHSGLTAAINSVGSIVGPTVTSLIWFSNKDSSTLFKIMGLILTIISIVMITWTKKENGKSGYLITGKWVRLVIIGWMFAAISTSAQFIATQYDSQSPYGFIVNFNIAVFLILLVISIRKKNGLPLLRAELIPGIFSGLTIVVTIVMIFKALENISATILYPVSISITTIMVLLATSIFYKEKIQKIGWIGCAVGIASVFILSIF